MIPATDPYPDRIHLPLEAALHAVPDGAAERSAPLYAHGTLLVKAYAPRRADPQTPHSRDEIYVVARGSGQFFDGHALHPFGPGDFLFAPAGSVHRFEAFTDDLVVWVMYYGPEGGEVIGASPPAAAR